MSQKRMWQGGPLREWSETKTPATSMSYGKVGYAGRYGCDRCLKAVNGVYLVQETSSSAGMWLCSDCRQNVRPKQAQPEALRRAK